MNKRKLFTLALTLCMVAILAIGGSLAYFTASDEATNVFTMGKVSIVQNEQERNASGTLTSFTQNQPLIPAVYSSIEWDPDRLSINGKGFKMFDDSMENVMDKVVTVTNTGTTNAYVRTIIAFEAGCYADDTLVHINHNADPTVINDWIENVTLSDGHNYDVLVCTYVDPLEAGKTTDPSLLQVFLNEATTQDYVETKIGDTYEIYAVSQAVQADGFETKYTDDTARKALNEAFAPITATTNFAALFGI